MIVIQIGIALSMLIMFGINFVHFGFKMLYFRKIFLLFYVMAGISMITIIIQASTNLYLIFIGSHSGEDLELYYNQFLNEGPAV
jgi:hypothetical protein